MNDDFFIDDVLLNFSKKEKKKVNSKDKGVRGERALCEVLTKRFTKHASFFRVVGSGNRRWQVNLTEQAKEILTSDLAAPPNFKFSIECKYGYADIDLSAAFDNGVKELDAFLDQTNKDAMSVNKLPMLCWRKPRHNWIAFIKTKDAPQNFTYKLHYREWLGVSLAELLTQKDNYFFKELT